MTAQNVSVGDGSLASVVAGINEAGAGVTATALQVGTNQYALEVTSNSTGTAGAATVDTQAFSSSSLGALQTTTAAQNAIVSIGGTGGFQVTSATNTVTGLLPGVGVNLSQVSASPVTITVAPDGSQMVDQVSALVSAANQVLSSISTDTAYNESTNTAAPLNGQTSLNELAQQVLSIVGQAVGSSGSGSDGTAGESAGLAITSSGTITFNQSAFEAAYDKNPTAVQAMFTEGGTFSAAGPAYDGQVSVAGATDRTVPGDYAVSISQSASQAVDVGSTVFGAPTSTVGAAESYTISSGPNSATYAVSAGESVADVISGLNGALAAAGIDVSASLSGSAGAYQVQLSSADYGSAATFGVSTTGSDQLGATAVGEHLYGHRRGGDHRRADGDRVRSGPVPVRSQRPGRRPRPHGLDPGDHLAHATGHRRLPAGDGAGAGQSGRAVDTQPERPDRRHHQRLEEHPEQRDGSDRPPTAAGQHATSDPDPGVHPPGGDPVAAFLGKPVPDRFVQLPSSSSSGLSSLSSSSSGSSSSGSA